MSKSSDIEVVPYFQSTPMCHAPKAGYFLARFQALDLLKSLERANCPPSSHALAAVLGEVAEVPEVEVRDGPNDLDALKMVVYWGYERDITRWE